MDLRPLTQKTAVFYTRPLIARWLKTFKQPTVAIISDHDIPTDEWRTRLKTENVASYRPDRFIAEDGHVMWDLLVIQLADVSQNEIDEFASRLKKGGAFILITQNLRQDWTSWQSFLESIQITDHYPVGIHPKGAAAWWPFTASAMRLPGVLLDNLSMFFPGRYQLGLRFGRYWLVRGLKRDDQTIL